MNNFQKKLNQIEQQLKKEEKNVHFRNGGGVYSGGSDRGIGRNIHLSTDKKITNKGGNRMISAEAAKGDILKLIDEAKAVTAIGAATVIILKAILVAVKVILTTRTNTKEIMVKLGIPLEKKEVTPETKED